MSVSEAMTFLEQYTCVQHSCQNFENVYNSQNKMFLHVTSTLTTGMSPIKPIFFN